MPLHLKPFSISPPLSVKSKVLPWLPGPSSAWLHSLGDLPPWSSSCPSCSSHTAFALCLRHTRCPPRTLHLSLPAWIIFSLTAAGLTCSLPLDLYPNVLFLVWPSKVTLFEGHLPCYFFPFEHLSTSIPIYLIFCLLSKNASSRRAGVAINFFLSLWSSLSAWINVW